MTCLRRGEASLSATREKGGLRQRDDSLRCWQAEEGCEAFWDPEQLDGDLASSWGSCIASQPLLPRKAIMRPLRPGQGRRRAVRAGREGRRHLHLQTLACEQLHARPPMLPSAPVTPEQRSRPHGKRMQQYAHLTWLLGDAALPLTLLAQRTRATTADAGRIDHTQTAIGFSAPLVDAQGLPSRNLDRRATHAFSFLVPYVDVYTHNEEILQKWLCMSRCIFITCAFLEIFHNSLLLIEQPIGHLHLPFEVTILLFQLLDSAS